MCHHFCGNNSSIPSLKHPFISKVVFNSDLLIKILPWHRVRATYLVSYSYFLITLAVSITLVIEIFHRYSFRKYYCNSYSTTRSRNLVTLILWHSVNAHSVIVFSSSYFVILMYTLLYAVCCTIWNLEDYQLLLIVCNYFLLHILLLGVFCSTISN